MRSREFVRIVQQALLEQGIQMSQQTINTVVQTSVDTLIEQVAHGETISFAGLGRFTIHTEPERIIKTNLSGMEGQVFRPKRRVIRYSVPSDVIKYLNNHSFIE